MPVTKRKATGAHFTRPDLARLVAERVAALFSGLEGPLLHARSGLAATATMTNKTTKGTKTTKKRATVNTDRCFIRA